MKPTLPRGAAASSLKVRLLLFFLFAKNGTIRCLFCRRAFWACFAKMMRDGVKKEKSQESQLRPKMEDLVDSPLSVIISCVESHKNAAGLTEKKGAS